MLDFKTGQVVARNERTQPGLHGETGVIIAIWASVAIVKWDADKVSTAIDFDKIDILETFFDESDAVI